MSDSLWPHESQHTRPPCPSPTPGVHSDSRPSSQWCHPAISSSVIPFSSRSQSLPASESFPMSQLFTWGGQSIGVSASASFLPKNTQDWGRHLLLLLLSHFSRVRLCVTPQMAATRFPHPWDSPGKNTGVGCHFLLQCRKVKSESEVAQSFLTLCDPMDCSLPGYSIHGIFQARVLEWGAIAFSRGRHLGYIKFEIFLISPLFLLTNLKCA